MPYLTTRLVILCLLCVIQFVVILKIQFFNLFLFSVNWTAKLKWKLENFTAFVLVITQDDSSNLVNALRWLIEQRTEN